MQAAQGTQESPSIYDDADWYALLLHELVEAKMSSTQNGASSNGAPALPTITSAAALNSLRRDAKTRRANVDVKASKGRKMKYTVHEPLQNFMAPENRGTWGERQIDELFGGLLGRKVRGGLEERSAGESESDGEVEKGALRLFGGR